VLLYRVLVIRLRSRVIDEVSRRLLCIQVDESQYALLGVNLVHANLLLLLEHLLAPTQMVPELSPRNDVLRSVIQRGVILQAILIRFLHVEPFPTNVGRNPVINFNFVQRAGMLLIRRAVVINCGAVVLSSGVEILILGGKCFCDVMARLRLTAENALSLQLAASHSDLRIWPRLVRVTCHLRTLTNNLSRPWSRHTFTFC